MHKHMLLYKKRNKRPLNLLEVIIGMVLTAILLTTLFSSFRQLIQTGAMLEKVHEERHWTYITNLRLHQILETLDDSTHFEGKKRSIEFIFDNGVDQDPNFCGKLEAKIVLEKEKVLFLIEPIQGETRRECFCKGAKNLTFSFYDPKHKKWVEKWKAQTLPPMMKMQIEKEEFSFLFPKAKREINFS